MSIIRNTEPSFLERIVLKALSKLTFDANGLRTVAAVSGSLTTVTTVTTCSTVTTVSAVNNAALGRTTPDGTGIQMSYLSYQQGFRRNLVVT